MLAIQTDLEIVMDGMRETTDANGELVAKNPVWILIPGGLRYYYGVFVFWLTDMKIIKPRKRFRSTVAVIFFISLLLPFVLEKSIYIPLVLISSLMIVLSFTISIYYLIGRRGSPDLSNDEG